ncbi:hypothetical protein C1646_771238 [Rhizophagus diaphanus]|nr:hypothetical protein C1646_771238 [Rhizophagus diaphanus] [Rhizophagus sp. MUCL 43196]
MNIQRFKYHVLENFNRIIRHRNVQTLADLSWGRRLTGKDLVNQCVIREARRLQIYDRNIIDLTTNFIWNDLSPSRRNHFNRLANNANNINGNRMLRINSIDNTDTLNRIAQITYQQITNNYLEQSFYNGTNFNDNNSFESSILPSGFQ